MPSESDRTRLVAVSISLTDEMLGRLKEIAGVPPGAPVAFVVRHLLDIGFSKWKPTKQQYRIEMMVPATARTSMWLRLDQRDRIDEIMAMGYARAVVFDVALRLGDQWRKNGSRSEKVETPDTGGVLPVPEANQPGRTPNDGGAQLPREQAKGTRERIDDVRALLRGDDADRSFDHDSQEQEEEFPDLTDTGRWFVELLKGRLWYSKPRIEMLNVRVKETGGAEWIDLEITRTDL